MKRLVVTCSIKHSLFGASKAAGDAFVQKCGRHFGLPTCCLRGVCLKGPSHSGVERHGFLSYLVKVNVSGGCYRVYGYKGKQVRDNTHSYDVARFAEEFIGSPCCAEAYNIGGGRANSYSILAGFARVEKLTGNKMDWEYSGKARGGHICYISDLAKIKEHFPNWTLSKSVDQIFSEIFQAWRAKA